MITSPDSPAGLGANVSRLKLRRGHRDVAESPASGDTSRSPDDSSSTDVPCKVAAPMVQRRRLASRIGIETGAQQQALRTVRDTQETTLGALHLGRGSAAVLVTTPSMR